MHFGVFLLCLILRTTQERKKTKAFALLRKCPLRFLVNGLEQI